MAQIPSSDLPVVNPDTGRINLEWYAALQRLVNELAGIGSGGVTSFEGRTGVVVATAGDYSASEVTNNSGVAGANVDDALDTLDAGKQASDTDLTALAALSGTGLVARTGAAAYAERTLTGPAAGVSVSNGDGVAGNPTLALANDLAALEGLGSTGLAARTAADTWAQRTITAGDAITVSDGDGVAGNPAVAITAGGVGTTQLADEGVTLAKLEHAGAYTLLLRDAGTAGDPAYTKISALTDRTGFGTGDKLMIEESSGELRKIDFDDLPGGGGGGGFSSVVIQTFTSSGTYTPTSGMDYCIIEAQAPGGGGGSADAGSSTYVGASGGEAGEYRRAVFDAATIGASQSITIGSVGAGGSGNGGNGGNAGDVSVGALMTANGGNGGPGTGSGASQGVLAPGTGGGTGSGGISVPGGAGQRGFSNSAALLGIGGFGGDSVLGKGGAGGDAQNSRTGIAGRGYGGGGGGAANNTTTAQNGGAGAPGIVIITEFCS